MFERKILIIASALILTLGSCFNAEEARISLNPNWKFIKVDELNNSDHNFHKVDFDDSSWETVRLPHTANIEPLLVNDQWQGTSWYRKTIQVPNEYDDHKVFVEFEAAMNQCMVWINGNLVEEHNGGYLPVVIDATSHIKKGVVNHIAVRLNNTDNAITGPKPLKILDFNMYGGLYRNAWLIVKDKVYISHPVLAGKEAGGGVFITTPQVSKEKSLVEIKTHVINEDVVEKQVEVVHEISHEGKIINEISSEITKIAPGNEFEFVVSEEFSNPKLWSPKSPNLYSSTSKLLVDGNVVDIEKNRFGIREFNFIDNELYINGEKTFLRGVNRHQEYPFIGYALSDNAQYRDAKLIKEAGFDYVRISHYPQSPAFMDACDELGLVVIDAILGWQYYFDSDLFREYCYRSAKELILRDRNHPCVLAWEMSLNETHMPTFFMERLHEIVHKEYPGDNVYSCGWVNDVYDIFLQARQHRLIHPDTAINKPYVVSEYGDWEYYSMNGGLNQHQMEKELRYEMSSRQKRAYGEKRLLQQTYNIQEAHNDNFNTPAFADGYWVMFDYNRGYHDDIEYSGVMDIFRIPKFSFYFFQSQRSTEAQNVLKLATYWTKDSPLDVKVFGNCEEVELVLNGKSIARQEADSDKNSTNLAFPPFTFNISHFESGELKAIGYSGGQIVSEDIVNTPGEPVALKLWIEDNGKAPKSGVNDVLFLYLAAVDAEGIIVRDYNKPVNLKTEGDVAIMNPDQIEAEAGIATALIRIGDSDDKLSFEATSSDLIGQLTIKPN